MENLSEADKVRLIFEDPNFVYVPRYGYSLEKVSKRYPDGMPTRAAAAKALLMTEEELEAVLQGAIAKLRDLF